MITNVILSVAEAYKAMINPPKFQRPSWVPASITEEHAQAFTEAVRAARSKNETLVEFNGKKFKISAKQVNEKLDPNAEAGVWISDFVHSDDPRFAGKSDEERKQMALAAWYQARRDAGIKEEDSAEIKHDNVADKQAEAEPMQAAPVQENDESEEDDNGDEEEPVAKTDDAKENPTDVEKAELDDMKEATEADSFSHAAHSASAAAKGTSNHELHAKARDAHVAAASAHLDAGNLEKAGEHLKSAQRHDFMHHRYKNGQQVKESATEKASEGPKKDEQEKLEPRAPGEKKFFDAHKDKVEIKDGNPLDSQDGTDKIVPADAPKAQNTSPAAPKADVALDAAKDAKSGEDAVKSKAAVPQTK